jgi:hypothetical protein
VSDQKMIEVKLPAEADLSADDLALLSAACQSVVSICMDGRGCWSERLKQLEGENWRVHWGLIWSAEASKGRCSEAATAPTIDEAFERLCNLARLHRVEGCP